MPRASVQSFLSIHTDFGHGKVEWDISEKREWMTPYGFRRYGNNTYGDGCVYANVFMWDEKWSDAAESELVDHYLKYSTRYKELNASRGTGITHLFRVKPDEKTGKGTVSVTDRFGDTFTYEVAW